MEYINIIAKEEITQPLKWPIVLMACLAIAAALGVFIWAIVTKRADETGTAGLLGATGLIGILLLIVTGIICSIFFQVPTGRYRYAATIDKDKITVTQYEEFIEEYNPTIEYGIYYWED